MLDYVPTGSFDGEHGRMLRGLLVAATKDTVHANTEAVEAAGLRPMMVDLGAFALTRVDGPRRPGGTRRSRSSTSARA